MADAPAFRLPNDSQRHAIYGKTGSGKTVAGLWALEKRDWLKRRWEILDIKRDRTIARIPRLEELGIDEPIGRQPGLYVRRPDPGDHAAIDAYLLRLWRRTRCGLFVDEGYEINPRSSAWRRVLTQGRSLRIPVIALSQRPAWLSPFFMSEMDFHQVFYLGNPDDLDRIAAWIPPRLLAETGPGLDDMRQDYHSYYFDVPKNRLTWLNPVPDEEEILDRFDRRMPHRVRLFRGLLSNARRSRLDAAV